MPCFYICINYHVINFVIPKYRYQMTTLTVTMTTPLISNYAVFYSILSPLSYLYLICAMFMVCCNLTTQLALQFHSHAACHNSPCIFCAFPSFPTDLLCLLLLTLTAASSELQSYTYLPNQIHA